MAKSAGLLLLGMTIAGGVIGSIIAICLPRNWYDFGPEGGLAYFVGSLLLIMLGLMDSVRSPRGFVVFGLAIMLPSAACWFVNAVHHRPDGPHGTAVLAFSACLAAALWFGRRIRRALERPRGIAQCPHCGYALAGLRHSGRCPECGEAFQLNRAAGRS